MIHQLAMALVKYRISVGKPGASTIGDTVDIGGHDADPDINKRLIKPKITT